MLTARWLGQDNHDLAQAKNLEGASGIQDLHVQLMGLVRNRPIKQVVLGEGLYLWKSDTTSASNWKLVVERTDGSGVADLYAEPPKVDRNGSEFKVTIIYEDGSKVPRHSQGNESHGQHAESCGQRREGGCARCGRPTGGIGTVRGWQRAERSARWIKQRDHCVWRSAVSRPSRFRFCVCVAYGLNRPETPRAASSFRNG